MLMYYFFGELLHVTPDKIMTCCQSPEWDLPTWVHVRLTMQDGSHQNGPKDNSLQQKYKCFFLITLLPCDPSHTRLSSYPPSLLFFHSCDLSFDSILRLLFFTLTLPLMSLNSVLQCLLPPSSSPPFCILALHCIYWSPTVGPLSPSHQLCVEAPFSPVRESRMNRRAYWEQWESLSSRWTHLLTLLSSPLLSSDSAMTNPISSASCCSPFPVSQMGCFKTDSEGKRLHTNTAKVQTGLFCTNFNETTNIQKFN